MIVAASAKAKLVSEGFGMLWLHIKNPAILAISILILNSCDLGCTSVGSCVALSSKEQENKAGRQHRS